LGRMLKGFGIVSANLKICRDPVTGKDTVVKGYKRETFNDAWVRYVPLPKRYWEGCGKCSISEQIRSDGAPGSGQRIKERGRP
jgi:hypothetical protein